MQVIRNITLGVWESEIMLLFLSFNMVSGEASGQDICRLASKNLIFLAFKGNCNKNHMRSNGTKESLCAV